MVMRRRNQDLLGFAAIVVILVLINIIGTFSFVRLDLTTEKRYSLNENTKSLLGKVNDKILFKIYLEGEFPADFQRLQRETKQMLDEFRAYNSNVEYTFINPNDSEDEKIKRETWEQLRYKGLEAFQIEVNQEGGRSQLQIFPGAIATYGDKEVAVALLISQFATDPGQQVNSSIEKLEFSLANAIKKLILVEKPNIAFLLGNGELEAKYVADIGRELSQYYNVSQFNLRQFDTDSTQAESIDIAAQMQKLSTFDALIIAKPTAPFNDLDKLLIDQYIMNGGKTLWFIDAVNAEMDSLSSRPQFLAYPTATDLNLTDWLFKYGVRVNTNLVQDMIAGGVNDRRSINRWIYFPLILPQVNHPITKDLNAVKLEFASTVDTTIAPGVKKTFLLRTSPYSRVVSTPHMVNLQTLYEEHNEAQFRQPNLPVAVLLEGTFQSTFKNRILPKDENGQQIKVRENGAYSQMLVVGDGDVIKNQLNIINSAIPKGRPLPLGFDQFTNTQYGNKEFILNTIDYMLDDSGLISIRSRELNLRMLDFNKIKESRNYWRLLNTLLPIGLVLLFGAVYGFIRKRRYAKK